MNRIRNPARGRIAALPLILLSLATPLFPGATAAQVGEPTPDAAPPHSVAVSFNPLGFVQFGPLLNAELGLGPDLALTTHVRFIPLGVLSHVAAYDEDGLDRLRGIGVGGGVLYFLAGRTHRPYVGAMLEYAATDALYADGDQWESTEHTGTVVVLGNGGVRFRLERGFFINSGAFVGVAVSRWAWEYTDPTYGGGGNGTTLTPFGMLELAFGLRL